MLYTHRYFVGIHQLVWGMEKAEAARKHRSVWDVRNPMLQGLTLQVGTEQVHILLTGKSSP